MPPLYFQHQGHSRTIVGVEVMKSGGGGSGGGSSSSSNNSSVRLLVFDPSNSKMANFLAGANDAMKQLRKNSGAVKSRQYQVCCTEQGVPSVARFCYVFPFELRGPA